MEVLRCHPYGIFMTIGIVPYEDCAPMGLCKLLSNRLVRRIYCTVAFTYHHRFESFVEFIEVLFLIAFIYFYLLPSIRFITSSMFPLETRSEISNTLDWYIVSMARSTAER